MFDKILIANRGEIACRVAATCRRLGIASVAVYSDADAHAKHVAACDEAVHIGGAAAADSYLRIERIIDAARATGAQAIHPGYGFLSENEDFARACEDAGIVFVGPPVEAIAAMGSKAAAKALMHAAAVPLVPGYHGDDQSPELLQREADRIGYPVLLKASAGGGGKGMRVVERAADFAAALASCQREAAASFGNDRVLIEKYLQRPRHVEVQVFGDTYGNAVYLFDRDCSVQRRHQKVLEEAPAPGLADALRQAMGEAAVAAARAVGYVGAGTVEFIMTGDAFYFMEMNTRLQVEHPVTEMVTGLDLVEWQLRVAAGEPLPLRQPELHVRGHAIEARLYAEHPARGFLPSTGRLKHLRFPAGAEFAAGAAVRIDSGVREGDAITPFYDPMIAKLIVHADTRAQALATLGRALRECEVVGLHTNAEFLQRIVASRPFADADLDTGLIERHRDALFAPRPRRGGARPRVRGAVRARAGGRGRCGVAVGRAAELAAERRLSAHDRMARARRRHGARSPLPGARRRAVARNRRRRAAVRVVARCGAARFRRDARRRARERARARGRRHLPRVLPGRRARVRVAQPARARGRFDGRRGPAHRADAGQGDRGARRAGAQGRAGRSVDRDGGDEDGAHDRRAGGGRRRRGAVRGRRSGRGRRATARDGAGLSGARGVRGVR